MPPTGWTGAPGSNPASRLEDHTILNDGANPDFASLNTTNWEGLTELAIYQGDIQIDGSEDVPGKAVSTVTKEDVPAISKFCTKELLNYLEQMQALGSEKEKSDFLAELIGQPPAEAAKLLKKQAKKPVKREALLQLLENAKLVLEE